MTGQSKSYILALLSVLFWSTVATAFKITLEYFNPTQLLLYSSFVSFVFLLLYVIFTGKFHALLQVSRKDMIKCLALGVLNPFLYYLVLFRGYSLLPAQEALTLNYTWAIVVVILSAIVLKQKLTLKSFLALLVSFSGVICIATKGNPFELKFSSTEGVALAIGSSLIWASFWVFNAREEIEASIKLLLNFTSGFTLILIFTVITGSFGEFKPVGLAGAGYIGLFEMGLTFVLWLNALKFSKSTAAISNLVYLSPFLSLIFINFFLKEKIMISTIAGLILIISGIFFQFRLIKRKY
jgi:drug/metabolite transporter (DMT)-like permease